MSVVNFLSIAFLLITSACTTNGFYRPPERRITTDITSKSHQSCSLIEPPEHGSVKLDENRDYHFYCEDGYMMQGVPFISCMLYNMGREKPKCIKPTGTCPKPGPPKNGAVECDEDLTPGKYCRYSCFEGYKLYGSPERKCMLNNQMDGGAVCERIQGNYDYSQSAGNSERRPAKTTEEPISHSEIKYSHSPRPPPYPTYTKPTNDNPCLNLQCEQLCLNTNGVFQCKCCAGFKLNSDYRTCRVNNPDRINMNECLRQHKKVGDVRIRPCGGSTFDYHKNDCVEKAPRLPSVSRPTPIPHTYSFESCSEYNGGCEQTCLTIDSRTVTCTCQNGYELQRDGKHCSDINECIMHNFDCSHGCVNVRGGAYCTCPSGFILDTDKKTCIDIDECLQDDMNHCQHYCENTMGSYSCSCKPGYILIEGHNCEGCRRNSYWSYQRNACVDCPKNSHSDSEGKTSLHDCVCDSGYTGTPGEYVPCEDIDECTINNFGCSHLCINIPGSAYCICPPGFMLDTNSKTCIDIDECKTKNGGCEGLCINTNGSFHCTCQEGFTASSTDRYSCDDIDECSENNGGCEHLCINYRGGFYCGCNRGHRLDNTLKNCTEIRCPKLPQPNYSHMECKLKNESLPEGSTYPAGTKCSFPCGKGFKNVKDDNKMKCQSDGTWNGTLPECKPQSCPPLKVPENADIHPPSCYIHGAKVKQKCTFSCHAGYILEGFPVFTCKNNLTWAKEDIPVCKPVIIPPVITCPGDIQSTLLQGKATQNIAVPEPTTNVEYYEVHPSWVIVNKPVEFPVGVTQVTFTANSSFNEMARCGVTVTILDEEPPVFHSCPESITIEGASGTGELVTWDEPVVTDNVELVSVYSVLEPNVTLTPGTYLAEYVARDSSGNIEKCSFNISIVRMNCSDLRDPVHGKANCMDWMFGKLCSPECEEGYMRNPDEQLYYSCDDTGVWEPNELISECLQFILAPSSGCQDGFELKKVEADILEHEVCIACPSNAVWSSTTRKCEK